jgi:two-component system OmpR family response regulator
MDQPEPDRLAVVIEDDADVRHLLKTVLTQSGFQTILTSNGADGIEAVREYRPLLTTLDVSMPGMDGFAVAKRIREFSSTYIVMLTALAEEIDIVQGLDSGADDYLLKPFRPRELRARIETMLRRPRDRSGLSPVPVEPATVTVDAAPVPATRATLVEEEPAAVTVPAELPETVRQPATARRPVKAPEPLRAPVLAPAVPVTAGPMGSGHSGSVHEHRGLVLDVEARLVAVDDQPIELTRSEFDLLAAMLESGRRVRSKADLVLSLRGESYVTTYFVNDADKRAVEVHMANLRRKIGDSTTHPRWIETVRGVGYRLAVAD